MLFNSPAFLFLFLPVATAGFFLSGRWNIVFLSLASLVFYSFWHLPDIALLLASMGVNYLIGIRLQSKPGFNLLCAGIAANVLVISYFKYAGFLAGNINALTGSHLPLLDIALPLGVSFFTLHEVTWLVDSYQGKIKKAPFSHFLLYITFFPQLIAGPIVRFTEVMDQYKERSFGTLDINRFAQGALLFCIGLGKKVLLADYFATIASPVFGGVASGLDVSMLQAWAAAISYSFQIYFDFSAYSDMALGLGVIFGIALPVNFNSPYKAASIIEFWRHWHMTLSRFLRDYLYIPMGGNRAGVFRRYFNLMLVMLIGGLWHGASWNFVIWGGLHGLYLLVNHAWRELVPAKRDRSDLWDLAYGGLTYLAVVVAWVFFRAPTLDGACAMLQAMVDFSSLHKPQIDALSWFMGLTGAGIIWFAPNATDIAERFFQAEKDDKSWRRASFAAGIAAGLAVFLTFTGMKSEFIYFQF